MSEFNISVEAGKTKVLHTAGKYCDRDIVVKAEKGVDYYDTFWDSYQLYGNRTNYDYGFSGNGWTDETFKPKYDITVKNGTYLFAYCLITDLVKSLNDCGVVLDLSQSTASGYLVIGSSTMQTIPIVDARKRQQINYFIYSCSALRIVEKIILKDDGSQQFNANSFGQLPALEEIRFEGCIGKSLEIKGSPLLSTESVDSIISCLKDLTGATAQTLTLHATVGANMTDEQKAAISTKNWTLVY